MEAKSKLSKEEKLKYVLKCLEEKEGIWPTSLLAGVNDSTLRQWIRNYQNFGVDGLEPTSTNNHYTSELKEMAVKDYVAGNGSLADICKKYRLRSKGLLYEWVLKYNCHEKLEASRTGGMRVMTDGRKTTFDERVEIVKYCIENEKNYNMTAQKYQVSYRQVNYWTNRYEKHGINALEDKRGKDKAEEELSEIDRLKAQNKLLEAENRRKQMEIDFLKKLEELERGRF